MNKVIIGVLIIAAGTGIFFLTRNKQAHTSHVVDKNLLHGKWNAISEDRNDSNYKRYLFNYQEDGKITQSLADSIVYSASYSWQGDSALVIKKDSTSQQYAVVLLTKDTLQLRNSNDSLTRVFTRIR